MHLLFILVAEYLWSVILVSMNKRCCTVVKVLDGESSLQLLFSMHSTVRVTINNLQLLNHESEQAECIPPSLHSCYMDTIHEYRVI